MVIPREQVERTEEKHNCTIQKRPRCQKEALPLPLQGAGSKEPGGTPKVTCVLGREEIYLYALTCSNMGITA